jgi:hypothetical protein
LVRAESYIDQPTEIKPFVRGALASLRGTILLLSTG